MQGALEALKADASSTASHGPSTFQVAVATVLLGWYIAVVLACTVGHVQLYTFLRLPLDFSS